MFIVVMVFEHSLVQRRRGFELLVEAEDFAYEAVWDGLATVATVEDEHGETVDAVSAEDFARITRII